MPLTAPSPALFCTVSFGRKIDLLFTEIFRRSGITLNEVPNALFANHLNCMKRVRPVAMTAISTMVGLVPIMLSSATGSDVTHRIAAPMLGGMLTVTVLNLVVLPVIYSLVLQYQERYK